MVSGSECARLGKQAQKKLGLWSTMVLAIQKAYGIVKKVK